MAQDPQYREQQYECQRHWRMNRPLDQYQKQYRRQHPRYVQKNREQQQLRNRKHTALLGLLDIVKMDASMSVKSSAYFASPTRIEAPGQMAHMDALFLQLTVLQKNVG
jgi:hypothetical protein